MVKLESGFNPQQLVSQPSLTLRGGTDNKLARELSAYGFKHHVDAAVFFVAEIAR